MFEGFKLRYITGGSALSCKYSNPLATPKAIFILASQANGFLSAPISAQKLEYNEYFGSKT